MITNAPVRKLQVKKTYKCVPETQWRTTHSSVSRSDAETDFADRLRFDIFRCQLQREKPCALSRTQSRGASEFDALAGRNFSCSHADSQLPACPDRSSRLTCMR